MKYRVDTHSDIPPSRQLVERVLDALARAEFLPGDRLPSVRVMAGEAPSVFGELLDDLTRTYPELFEAQA